jgi:peptidoglycan/xylan/chitin deacetylase (PgdA/CDA1 family)
MIKHKIRDILILLFDVFGIIYLYQYFKQKKGPLVRILCFHDVEDGEWFEKIISLCIEKYHIITPEEFHNKQFKFNKINILLTFDDGYDSWINICLPILNKFEITALFFINSGLLDAEKYSKDLVHKFMEQNLCIRNRKALSWHGAHELIKSGHAVGGHTVSHINLASSCSEDVIKDEIQLDKKNLETELDTTFFDFAYPFGTQKFFSKYITYLVLTAGYKYHYSAISNFYDATLKSNKTHIPRTLIEDNQTLKSVQMWIEGGYDLFIFFKL